MSPRVHRIGAVVAAALVAAGAACRAPGGKAQSARASDEWVRSYPLDAGGEVQILNTSGNVEIETAPIAGVEVRAERVAHATTESGARELLTHIELQETVAAGRVAIETQRIKGVMIGASFDVHYHVRLSSSAAVRARTADGNVTVTGLGGKASLTVTNGGVVARALSGSVEARVTNGSLDVEIVKGTAEFIDLRVVNGRLDLAIPKSLNANLSATSVNGRVQVTAVEFEPFGDAARDGRRVRGRINAGGSPIELSATNGNIHVRGYE